MKDTSIFQNEIQFGGPCEMNWKCEWRGGGIWQVWERQDRGGYVFRFNVTARQDATANTLLGEISARLYDDELKRIENGEEV